MGKKQARQRRILAELEQRPALRVAELAEMLAVSTETVRRDFDELSALGQVSRTYGGAVRRSSSEPSVNERHHFLVAERERMSKAVPGLLAGARTVMFGSGATTVHVARRLAIAVNDLTVIAHSFGVATMLSLNPTITVIIAPGRYHAAEGSTQGAQTLRFLEDFRADWAVIGASGLGLDGPSDALVEEAEVYRGMVARSDRLMVVADHSKFLARFPARYAQWSQVDTLVTDAQPDRPLAKALADAGVRVVIA
ncbi:MAG: DeoR/GlpR transcriptional regulator [Rhodospirillaceae bacterium]|nr:DeoR/GlpR transcriptional regulator [Rhodospirillaceae bacterium]